MAKKYLRLRQTFSPTLRTHIVGLIESGQLSVSAASREYLVSSTTLYRWIYRYSTCNKKETVLVVEKNSREEQLTQLRQRIAELEQAVGHKQMQIDYYKKFIDLASEEVGEDLKKKYDSTVLLGSFPTRKRSPGR
ncbi:MAG: transposase [Balneolaceae bacterium]|nr:transposase [Balneolaceae bacterium]